MRTFRDSSGKLGYYWESNKEFVDALRECLGLGPLYGEDDSSRFYLQERSPEGLLLGGSANASGMVPQRSTVSR